VTFQAPLWLLMLLAVAALAALYVVRQLRRTAHAVRFTNTALLVSLVPRRSGRRRHVAFGVVLLALGMLVVSLAGPSTTVKVPRDRDIVMLALDVSSSMRAGDIAPTRFQAMRTAAKYFVSRLPAAINLGLVSFSGTADTLATPTTDRVQVRADINHLQVAESTAIGEAIFTCLLDIEDFEATLGASASAPPARIVLLSDGYNTAGRGTDQAAAAARAMHVPVSTIAFGTGSGTLYLDGDTVPVPVDHATLSKIAIDTGGSYTAAASESELEHAYEHLDDQISHVARPKDISPWFLRAGVLLVLLGATLSAIWTDGLV